MIPQLRVYHGLAPSTSNKLSQTIHLTLLLRIHQTHFVQAGRRRSPRALECQKWVTNILLSLEDEDALENRPKEKVSSPSHLQVRIRGLKRQQNYIFKVEEITAAKLIAKRIKEHIANKKINTNIQMRQRKNGKGGVVRDRRL